MGITSKDIAAQRAMLERGEEKRKADWLLAERHRLRDSFAAAALTGLLSNIQTYQLVAVTRQAYDLADEMLIQRSSRPGTVAADKAIQDAKDFARIREQFEAWQKERSAGVPEMDSGADRNSAATQGSAHSCGQPFDSAPTTQFCPHIRGTVTQHCSLNFTLTDEEREAIADAVAELTPGAIAATLRNLLERTK